MSDTMSDTLADPRTPDMDNTNHELILTLGRVEGKIDTVLQAQARLETRLDEHNRRIGSLERWQSKMVGAGAAAGTIASIIWDFFTKGS